MSDPKDCIDCAAKPFVGDCAYRKCMPGRLRCYVHDKEREQQLREESADLIQDMAEKLSAFQAGET